MPLISLSVPCPCHSVVTYRILWALVGLYLDEIPTDNMRIFHMMHGILVLPTVRDCTVQLIISYSRKWIHFLVYAHDA